MTLWIDGDACPRRAREVVVSRLRGSRITGVVISDRRLVPLPDDTLTYETVDPGPGAADDRIRAGIRPGDLAMTRDLELAADLMNAGVTVINDRGRLWEAEGLERARREREFTLALDRGGHGRSRRATWGEEEARVLGNTLDRLIALNEK